MVTVLRDGQPSTVQASQLVTGDIVMLGKLYPSLKFRHHSHMLIHYSGTGVRVPADLRLLKSEGLMIDRGVLTGEVILALLSTLLPYLSSCVSPSPSRPVFIIQMPTFLKRATLLCRGRTAFQAVVSVW
jgi:hypothetical protein